MSKQSAGILLFRFKNNSPQVLLVHPGGPYWRNKDEGAWSVPKGEFAPDEDPLSAAIREFKEETGFEPGNNFIALRPQRLKSGKRVYVWMCEGDLDTEKISGNIFQMEWPPRSGKKITVPEVDRAAWFGLQEALRKINPGQIPFLHELAENLKQN